jgi:hypothetical protein
MARDPGSVWKPLPEAGAPDGLHKDKLIFHSTGDNLGAAATWRYFDQGAVVVESNFIVGWGPDHNDPTLQIMDSTDHADANVAANDSGISVEVTGDGVGPYTPWQVSELIRIGRWARQVHGIPPQIIPSPTGAGFGWHVMFGAPGPWTTVAGKVCPGAARIAQLKAVVFPAVFADIDTEETQLMALLTAQDHAYVDQYGGLVNAIAQRARQVEADGSLPYGLDSLRAKLDALATQVAAADANDAPALLAPAIAQAVVAALKADPAHGSVDAVALGSIVDSAVRHVLGGLDNPAA